MRGDNALCSSAALINSEYPAKIAGNFAMKRRRGGRGFKSDADNQEIRNSDQNFTGSRTSADSCRRYRRCRFLMPVPNPRLKARPTGCPESIEVAVLALLSLSAPSETFERECFSRSRTDRHFLADKKYCSGKNLKCTPAKATDEQNASGLKSRTQKK